MQTFGDSLRAEGKAEGVVRTLTLVLESRFGTLPEEVRDMIGTADAPQLDRWAVKAANAPTLDAVINGHDAS